MHSTAGLRIGVLALQGAFREHAAAVRRLGAEAVEVRRSEQVQGLHGLILPGGESTVMGKLLVEWEIMDAVRERYAAGMPIYGTCAGLILLCTDIEGHDQPRLGLLDATVRRNAFGRQVDSFEAPLPVKGLDAEPFPAVFIRAPLITRTGPEVEVLAAVPSSETTSGPTQQAVAVRQDSILATSFHPELTKDDRVHRYFLDMVVQSIH